MPRFESNEKIHSIKTTSTPAKDLQLDIAIMIIYERCLKSKMLTEMTTGGSINCKQ